MKDTLSLYIVHSEGYLDLVSVIESDNDVVGDALRVEGVWYPHTGEIGAKEKYPGKLHYRTRSTLQHSTCGTYLYSTWITVQYIILSTLHYSVWSTLQYGTISG